MKKKIIVVLSTLTVLLLFFFKFNNTEPNTAPPPLITNNIVDLSKIDEISKYRSCAGHVVVPLNSDERKRNMKHYFNLKEQYKNSDDGVAIFAPFTGMIGGLHSIEDNPKDQEISFLKDHNDWGLGILHVDVLDSLNEGDTVEGGQIVGYVNQNGFDVIYAIYAEPDQHTIIEGWYDPYSELDSMFNHMNDQVWQEYLQAGVESKDKVILTKEQRDVSPCLYRESPPDLENPNDRDDNWIKLN